MVDVAQILLLTVVVIITVLMVVIGIYIVLVLRDFRKTIKYINSILGETEKITHTLGQPATGFLSLLKGLSEGIHMFRSLGK